MADQLVETRLDAEALAGARGDGPGTRAHPGSSRLRRGALDLERADRQAPRVDRAVQRRGRRRRRGQLRARPGARPLDQGRRPQRRRQRRQRRRARDRPLADARCPRGSGHQDGARAGRCDLGGLRSRDAALRARGPRRCRLDDRRGGVDPSRRARSSAPQVRPLDRQPRVRRHRHGRRAVPEGERDRERGSVLGGPRRRQQLRRRHVVRVPGAPGRADGVRRGDLLPVRGCGDDPPGLARLHGLGAGGAELARDLLEHPAVPAVPARAPRHADRRRRRGVLRLGRGGRARCAAASRARATARRRQRPLALAGPAERVRRDLPEGRAPLLEVAVRRRALRRGDRRDPRARRPQADAAHRHRDLASRRSDDRASARPRRRTAAATRRSS